MRDTSLSHIPMKGFPMSKARLALALLLLAATVGSLSCTSSTGVDDNATAGPRLLTAAPDSPPLSRTEVSFYAVKGKSSGVDLWYRPRPGRSDSTKFVEFRLGSASLDRRPDGSTIADGDSVLITLSVPDPTHLIITYQPSGLKFSANDLPTLKMFYVACGDDYNYDGVVDAADDVIQEKLSIWRQEAASLPWEKLSSVVVKSTKEVEARLSGFTGYAISY
jgi:hypothetical protein